MVVGCDGDGGNPAQKFAIFQKKGYNYKKEAICIVIMGIMRQTN